jgi:hypothetical protein
MELHDSAAPTFLRQWPLLAEGEAVKRRTVLLLKIPRIDATDSRH